MPSHVVACPQCNASLRSSRPFPADKQVRCPQCGNHFVAAAPSRPSYLQSAVPPPPLLIRPPTRDRTPAIALAVVGALVLIGAGIGGTVYFMRPKAGPAPVKDETKDLKETREPKDTAADERLKKSEEENRKLAEQLAALKEREKKQEFQRLMDKGKEALEAQRYADAVAAFGEALKRYPDDADAKNALIKAQSSLVAAGKSDEDRKKKQEDYNRIMADAAKALDDKQYAAAVRLYDAALMVLPNDGAAAKARAEVLALLDKDEKEQQKLKEFKFHIDNGNAAMVRQDYATALAAFIAAEKVLPGNPEAIKLKNAAQDRLAAAQAQAMRAAQAQVEIAKGRDALRERRFDDAVAAFKKALDLMPDNPEATKGVADATAALNKAKVDYAQLITQGDNAMQARNFQAALTSYQAAAALFPNDPAAQRGIAAAQQALATVVVVPPVDNTVTLRNLLAQGQLAMVERRYADAATAFNAALAISPTDPVALAGLAEIKRIADRKALRVIEIANLFNGADQALKARQFSTAIKGYRDVLALDPDNVRAIEGLREARYQKAILEGQQALAANRFADAVAFFDLALHEKPGDPLATNQRRFAKSKIK
jgi:tetratricopeptide (TPR) repeat protein